MLHRNPAQTSPNIIPSYGAVSLTGTQWLMRNREAWDEQHHVFFAQCDAFYQNTISLAPAALRPSNKRSNPITGHDSWIIEAKDKNLLGRIQLQWVTGPYNHGVLLVDLLDTTPPNMNIDDAIAQLITSQFLAMGLDTIKVVPVSGLATSCVNSLTDLDPTKVLSLSLDWLPEPTRPLMFHFDRDIWLTSSSGIRSLESLSWLKKRMERMSKAAQFDEIGKKRPWIFNLLTLGRSRRRSEKMIHPLDKIRPRY